MKRWYVAMLAIGMLPLGCSKGGGVIPPTPSPVQILAVSATSQAADQMQATDACWITDSAHQLVASFGFKGLKGAAKVTPARAVPEFVPLFGTEPEIQTDEPAWVFAFEGQMVLPPNIVERDPTCVVVNGDATWYSTGASYIDGQWVEASAPPTLPSRQLPTIQP